MIKTDGVQFTAKSKDCEERFVTPELAKVLAGLQPVESPAKRGQTSATEAA